MIIELRLLIDGGNLPLLLRCWRLLPPIKKGLPPLGAESRVPRREETLPEKSLYYPLLSLRRESPLRSYQVVPTDPSFSCRIFLFFLGVKTDLQSPLARNSLFLLNLFGREAPCPTETSSYCTTLFILQHLPLSTSQDLSFSGKPVFPLRRRAPSRKVVDRTEERLLSSELLYVAFPERSC